MPITESYAHTVIHHSILDAALEQPVSSTPITDHFMHDLCFTITVWSFTANITFSLGSNGQFMSVKQQKNKLNIFPAKFLLFTAYREDSFLKLN